MIYVDTPRLLISLQWLVEDISAYIDMTVLGKYLCEISVTWKQILGNYQVSQKDLTIHFKKKTVTQNMLLSHPSLVFSSRRSLEVCEDGIQLWAVYDWQPGKRNISKSVYDSIITLLLTVLLALWAHMICYFLCDAADCFDCKNKYLRAQCERTGLGSLGRHWCLAPPRHHCEEVKG